jgi:hypothetical protein
MPYLLILLFIKGCGMISASGAVTLGWLGDDFHDPTAVLTWI